MIRIGPAGYPEGSRSPADGIRRIRRAGLDALELQFVRNVQFNLQKAEEARSVAKEMDVLLSAHAPYYINLNSPSADTREKSEEWVLRTLRAAQAYGAWIVVVHAAVYDNEGPAKATASVISALERVRKRAEEERLGAVIGLETMGRRSAWGTVPEILTVMEKVGGVIPVLDFAHMQARGLAPLGEEGLRKLFASLSGQERLHCHISGIEFSEAGERRHLRLGEGLDHRMVLSSLVESALPATVICESTAPLEDAQSMRRFLDTGI